MKKQTPTSILDGIGPSTDARRRDIVGLVIGATGATLWLSALAVVVVAPILMSSTAAMALQLVIVGLIAAHGLVLAQHSRRTHVSLERAYSAHLEELSQRLRTMAYQDALTGLYNHRYFYEQFSHEIERSARYGQPLSVLLMDMNDFKRINDTYGHMTGDKALSLVGQVISRHIRGSDIAARYGGDEFVVLLPNTRAEEALATADKLSAAVEAAAAQHWNEAQIRLGLSIGIATCPEDSRSTGELLQIADGRMYETKMQRRHQQEARREIA